LEKQDNFAMSAQQVYPCTTQNPTICWGEKSLIPSSSSSSFDFPMK